MSSRKATVVKVYDSSTLIIRPNTAVKLFGVEPLKKGSEMEEKAKMRLEELVLGKKIEFQTLEWDRLGRSIAIVKIDGFNLNEYLKKFIEDLKI
ncbi:MAG: thermonuclease family protein [Candidatus Bathyarchaeia archaeon]